MRGNEEESGVFKGYRAESSYLVGSGCLGFGFSYKIPVGAEVFPAHLSSILRKDSKWLDYGV